jgi:hypothetical protein
MLKSTTLVTAFFNLTHCQINIHSLLILTQSYLKAGKFNFYVKIKFFPQRKDRFLKLGTYVGKFIVTWRFPIIPQKILF